MVSKPSQQPGEPAAHGVFFGMPLGELGLFTSIVMAIAVACISFFLVTFVSIFSIMIYNGFGNSLNYADSYKYIAFPAGLLMLGVGVAFFGTLWLRRKFRD